MNKRYLIVYQSKNASTRQFRSTDLSYNKLIDATDQALWLKDHDLAGNWRYQIVDRFHDDMSSILPRGE